MKQSNVDFLQLNLFSDNDFEKKETVIAEKDKSLQNLTKTISPPMHGDCPDKKYDHTDLFLRLEKSKFRSGFHLKAKDIEYIDKKGFNIIRQHAADFVAQRLAPADLPNDGKQTPMRGHPVFLAQHATACCCRGCFSKWHHIPAGRILTDEEQQYAVSVLMAWIKKEYARYKS